VREFGYQEVVMRATVRFGSGGDECAGYHYPGANGACVIMAGGFAVPKEPATDQFAARFQAAGFHVLAFDYRGLGESGGRPRLVLPVGRQIEDWRAAIGHAGTLPGVDPHRLAIWGFSASGGHVLRVAARDPRLSAAIAQTPNLDGPAGARHAGGHQCPSAMLRLTGRVLADTIGGLLGRAPLLVPLVGTPGSIAMLTTPDSQQGDTALDPDRRHTHWQRRVAARSVPGVVFYRPGREAVRVRCPLQVLVCADDDIVPLASVVPVAERAPAGELVRLPGGHYAPFLAQHEAAVAAQLDFLRRHLLAIPATTEREARA
jgi:pimeloyl-ACP methyl ester carboxylesterase